MAVVVAFVGDLSQLLGFYTFVFIIIYARGVSAAMKNDDNGEKNASDTFSV